MVRRGGQTYLGLSVPTALMSLGLAKLEVGGFLVAEPSALRAASSVSLSLLCLSFLPLPAGTCRPFPSREVRAEKPRGSCRKTGHKPLPGLSIFTWPQGPSVTELTHPARTEPLPSPWKQELRSGGCRRGLPYPA